MTYAVEFLSVRYSVREVLCKRQRYFLWKSLTQQREYGIQRKRLQKNPMTFFKKLCSRSLLDFFFKNKKEYEEKISEGADEFTASSGETFSNRRNEVYFQRQKKFQRIFFMMRTESMRFDEWKRLCGCAGKEWRRRPDYTSRWKKAFRSRRQQ